ncbi:diacylglycerol kinase family protein [Pedobacter sp. SD-b]|uniref:Diacylglycerol kinase family protein n=1 Tax=Pedobacter segetis TaxID=2793069 RepID=A0ABS1BIG7_9SPHI|nr:diacylglycerol kinase family protein [Pedobacter segetis]MBK0382602.1 diacylglycerol kinase family protein [Pedobacter segetis]
MEPQKFSITQRIKSFKYAFEGYKYLFKEEHNARVHLFFTILVVSCGFFFQINLLEWVSIFFAIGLVIVTEILNTAIEKLADFVSPNKNINIKIIKDLAAAAVFTSTIIAVIIGVIIFLPKLTQIL